MVQINPFKKDFLQFGGKKNKLKVEPKKTGGMGGRKTRYSSGVNTPEKRAADKKRNEEREASKKARIERSQAKGKRRGGGVRNRTDNPIGANTNKTTTSKSKGKGKGGGVTINGKPPSMTQKKLLAGGWSAKELEALINKKKK